MRTIIQYLLFVGLPLLGVLTVLKLGSQLSAPASVGGPWNLQPAVVSPGQSACAQFPIWPSQPMMVISQSGDGLAIKLNDANQTLLAGTLHDLTIDATQDQRRAPAFPLSLAGVVDRSVEPNTFTGYLEVAGCPTRLQLTGTRQVHTTSLTGEH